jgi:hypothetical protein
MAQARNDGRARAARGRDGVRPTGAGPAMAAERRHELLKDEYLQLERCILEFDGRALTIKAWSVSFSLAAVVGAFASHAPAVLLIAAFGSCMFWAIEGMWKTFQYAHYERVNGIEDYFAGVGPEPDPLQIGRAWYARWSGIGAGKSLCIMAWPRVALPHALVALLGVALFALQAAGVIQL